MIDAEFPGASTTFYDSDLIPGQLTPSVVCDRGARGFALVLNVPAGDDANGSSVTLRAQRSPVAPRFSFLVTVRVFPTPSAGRQCSIFLLEALRAQSAGSTAPPYLSAARRARFADEVGRAPPERRRASAGTMPGTRLF
ncbi:MAG: hypothetical protein IPF99_41040 [Deltaproteobacteria bacterium]|nr:hypothetical protein [Deltaproteobacteria bacterium]